MKAQEYFEKYFSTLPASDKDAGALAGEMIMEFLNEAEELIKKRNIKTDSGIVGVVRELNEKWNSVANKIERKHGFALLKRNIIWNKVLAEKYPEFERKKEH